MTENSQSIEELLKKGDDSFHQENYQLALEIYQDALELDQDNVIIYDKLITTLHKLEENWTEDDFIKSLSWTMKKQELEDPLFKRVHTRFNPEWKEIQKIITQLFQSQDKTKETHYVEKIISYQSKALYPLIDTLLHLKENLIHSAKVNLQEINLEIIPDKLDDEDL